MGCVYLAVLVSQLTCAGPPDILKGLLVGRMNMDRSTMDFVYLKGKEFQLIEVQLFDVLTILATKNDARGLVNAGNCLRSGLDTAQNRDRLVK
jgi:hypothetical protein